MILAFLNAGLGAALLWAGVETGDKLSLFLAGACLFAAVDGFEASIRGRMSP